MVAVDDRVSDIEVKTPSFDALFARTMFTNPKMNTETIGTVILAHFADLLLTRLARYTRDTTYRT